MSGSSSINSEPFYLDGELKNIHELDPSTDGTILDRVQGVACLVHKSCLEKEGEGGYRLKAIFTFEEALLMSLIPFSSKERKKICFSSEERKKFSKDISIDAATAFLVHDDLVCTVGHALTLEKQIGKIKKMRLVFGFTSTACQQQEFRVAEKDVYEIKEVVGHKYGDAFDYALVRLNRKVEDRTPLITDFSEEVAVKSEVLVLGHPLGSPMKLAKGRILSIDKYQFTTDLRCFYGNSGSPIFDKLGRVIGIGRSIRPFSTQEASQLKKGSSTDSLVKWCTLVQRLSSLDLIKNYLRALNGDLSVRYRLGIYYLEGIRAQKDICKGLTWLKKSFFQERDLESISDNQLIDMLRKEKIPPVYRIDNATYVFLRTLVNAAVSIPSTSCS